MPMKPVSTWTASACGCIAPPIVDDGSDDNTREVVRPFLDDNRINYYYQDNGGQSVARNNGLDRCGGELICFLDSDDLFNPEKLAVQVGLFQEKPDIDVLFDDYELIDARGEIISRDNMERFSGSIYRKLLIDNFISINSTMVRRKCFDEMGKMDESIRFSDDYDLWLRFSTRYKFHYEPVYFTRYRCYVACQMAQNLALRCILFG